MRWVEGSDDDEVEGGNGEHEEFARVKDEDAVVAVDGEGGGPVCWQRR